MAVGTTAATLRRPDVHPYLYLDIGYAYERVYPAIPNQITSRHKAAPTD